MTDEPAFDALAGGITVRVGAARRAGTKARYRLADLEEVRRFIEQGRESCHDVLLPG